MAAIYRAVKDGEKAEEWEGIKLVSAIAEGAELEQKLKAGWVDHPSKLAAKKVSRNAVDKTTTD